MALQLALGGLNSGPQAAQGDNMSDGNLGGCRVGKLGYLAGCTFVVHVADSLLL